MLNAPTSFSVIWKLVSVFLDASTARKVQVTSGGTVPDDIKALVFEQQLEAKFGGQAENRESDYWPPKLPSEIFNSDQAE